MSKWQQTSERMWEAILARVKNMRAEGATLQQICDQVGVNSKSIISEWISGSRKAQNASFSALMEYLENLGLDYRVFFPEEGSDNAKFDAVAFERLRAQNSELQQTVSELREKNACARGEIAALERQLARLMPAPEPVPEPNKKAALSSGNASSTNSKHLHNKKAI